MRRPWCLLLFAALAACGGEEPTSAPPAGARPPLLNVETPPPDRRPFELPAGPATEAGKIEYYLEVFRGGDPGDQAWAVTQLVRAGESGRGAIVAELAPALDGSLMLAETIVGALARKLPAPEAIPLLERAAERDDGTLRTLAAEALANTGSPEVLPLLLDLLDGGFDTSRAALRGIQRLDAPDSYRLLLGRFPDRLHANVLPGVVSLLAAKLPEAEALGFLRGAAGMEGATVRLPALRELLIRGRPEDRASASLALGEELSGPNRLFALGALGSAQDPSVLPRLLVGVRSADPVERQNAIVLLGGYRQKEAVTALWKAARDPVFDVRLEAHFALLEAGDPDARARVLELLDSSDAQDRLLAALVLVSLKEAAVGPALAAALDRETEPSVTQKLISALAMLRAPTGAPAVARALAREPESEPSLAFQAQFASTSLRKFPELPPEAVEVLRQALTSASAAVRMHAARALGRRGLGPEVTGDLRRLLADPNVHVRRAVVEVWPELDAADGEALRRAYRREGDGTLARRMKRSAAKVHYRWE